jgi:hypothetical protein
LTYSERVEADSSFRSAVAHVDVSCAEVVVLVANEVGVARDGLVFAMHLVMHPVATGGAAALDADLEAPALAVVHDLECCFARSPM